jgi:hypothetical protein
MATDARRSTVDSLASTAAAPSGVYEIPKNQAFAVLFEFYWYSKVFERVVKISIGRDICYGKKLIKYFLDTRIK